MIDDEPVFEDEEYFAEDEEEGDDTKVLRINFANIFYEIFMEMYDQGVGFEKATNTLTQKLLNEGVEANPQDAYAYVELVASRLSRISATKRLCLAMGLQSEYDDILRRELDLIYSASGKPAPRRQIIRGEHP